MRIWSAARTLPSRGGRSAGLPSSPPGASSAATARQLGQLPVDLVEAVPKLREQVRTHSSAVAPTATRASDCGYSIMWSPPFLSGRRSPRGPMPKAALTES
jgi:hypothetical protein